MVFAGSDDRDLLEQILADVADPQVARAGSKLKRHGMRKPDAQISGRTGGAEFRYGFDSGIA